MSEAAEQVVDRYTKHAAAQAESVVEAVKSVRAACNTVLTRLSEKRYEQAAAGLYTVVAGAADVMSTVDRLLAILTTITAVASMADLPITERHGNAADRIAEIVVHAIDAEVE
ncbi:hypothetical protein Lesp02_02870 [Lentzea sp. NBRC 105346]|uniref:hypothetical protein n=1 Tax=Lentzea sp. NBRC 105346 TaxID=3032205 RepID=UPI0024A02567|nr:hypothetical protein [Lentzea sp. NBRC 105346]GLZ28097.1 hypothetical protein Lesp02_02870 [Lentzea sp. NBRC 105346]